MSRTMSDDVCPECGEPYKSVSKVDARPGGALFENYVHSHESDVELIVDENCTHTLEWGEEAEQ